MSTETTERDWVEEIGKPSFDAIAEMVAAAQVDWDRLGELRGERDDFDPTNQERGDEEWAEQNPDDAEELAELEEARGDCEDEDDARMRIEEDPLSLRIFGERTAGEWETTSYELLLGTGGPAVRIVGDLNQHGEPGSAQLEVQDWFKPWTEYLGAENDVLMAYAAYFYCGE